MYFNDAVKTVNDAMKQVISNPNGTGHAAQIDGIDLKVRPELQRSSSRRQTRREQNLDGL